MRKTKEAPAKKAARLKRGSDAAQKSQYIAANLSNWQALSDEIDNAKTFDKMRVIIGKLARVVYLVAKNEAD